MKWGMEDWAMIGQVCVVLLAILGGGVIVASIIEWASRRAS